MNGIFRPRLFPLVYLKTSYRRDLKGIGGEILGRSPDKT
jgi:hypothetical protein